MSKSLLIPLGVIGLALFTSGYGQELSDQKTTNYTMGCPDSSKVRYLYSGGHLDEVVVEFDSFRRYIRISPKPCAIFTDLYYGVSKFALGDSNTGRIAWQAMLKLDPKREIWEFQLPLYLQAKFDAIKRDLWLSGAIVDPYGKDYIPPTFPDPQDDAQMQKLRTLFHNARLNAYLGTYESSKKEIKEYLSFCEKKKENPDPAVLIIKGVLISLSAPTNRSMLTQAMFSIESGMEADKQFQSRIVDSRELQAWGERAMQRFMIHAKDMAVGK